jgi:hypothetical protein
MANQYQAVDGKLFTTEQEAAAHNLTLGNFLCDLTVKQLEALYMEWQVPWRGQKMTGIVPAKHWQLRQS